MSDHDVSGVFSAFPGLQTKITIPGAARNPWLDDHAGPGPVLPTNLSETRPLVVGWFATSLFHAEGTGQLGITVCPGRKGPARSALFARSLPLDMAHLQGMGVSMLVPLIERFEFGDLGIRDYVTRAAEHGIETAWYPIRDGWIPGLAFARRIVGRIDAAIRDGRKVVMHCKAGHGRAGTMAACTLVALAGMHPREAILLTRATRANTIERGEQEAFVYLFAGVKPGKSHWLDKRVADYLMSLQIRRAW